MKYSHLYIRARAPYTWTHVTARGAFVISTRPIAGRRAHLGDEVIAVWLKGRLERFAATTRCRRGLTGVAVYKEVPDDIELCDDCVLADYAPGIVYRIYDGEGRLLYVGCSKDPAARLRAHCGRSKNPTPWWRLVDRWTLEEFESHEDALAAEARAIVAERPLFNLDLTDRAKLPGRRRSANLHLIGEAAHA